MLKITCSNPVCGTSFFFDEKKNPKATKVMCPKCKNVQPLTGGGTPPPPADEDDWFKRDTPRVASSPVIAPPVTPFIPEPDLSGAEDFFQKRVEKKAPPPPKPAPKPQQQSVEEIGWLVIHDENTETYTFDLRKGINRIGRKSDSTPLDVNIVINAKDSYMSRHHCDIEVRWQTNKSTYEYILSDRNSSNGTFVNAGKRLSRAEEIALRDGDTIQVGRTKLVLKLPSAVGNSQDAESWVRDRDYFKTIIQ